MEAKQYLRNNFDKGVNCPCCGKLVKLWKYSIHSTMARVLIELHHASQEDEFQHINDLWRNVQVKSGIKTDHCGDFSKLALWGLIKPKPKDPDENKRSSGYWAITKLGRLFVRNLIVVDQYLFMFDGHKFGEQGKISIIDALKKKFDYNELMLL